MSDDIIKAMANARAAFAPLEFVMDWKPANEILLLRAKLEAAEAARDAAIKALAEEGRERGKAEAELDRLREILKVE